VVLFGSMSEKMPKNEEIPFNLVDKTRELLKNRPAWMSYTKIRTDTELTESWLTWFAANKGNDPGAGKVQRLYDYLSNSKMTLA
jgi:hypothetical protein